MLEPKGTMTAYARAQGTAPSVGMPMHASRPTMAFVFMFVGGILIMIGGIVYLFLGRGFFSFFALLGFVCGTIVVAAAILVERQPARHAVWGTIGLVFALLSLPNFGGFIVGLVLSVVGASLPIAWQ